MLNSIRNFFENHLMATATPDVATNEQSYRLATTALLLEMTRADNTISPDESAAVERALGRAFGLDGAQIAEIVYLAEQERDAAACLFGFTRDINANMSDTQKEHIIELLWQVAYADGDLDRYEEHLVRKVADLLYVPHSAFISAKHRAAAAHSGTN